MNKIEEKIKLELNCIIVPKVMIISCIGIWVPMDHTLK